MDSSTDSSRSSSSSTSSSRDSESDSDSRRHHRRRCSRARSLSPTPSDVRSRNVARLSFRRAHRSHPIRTRRADYEQADAVERHGRARNRRGGHRCLPERPDRTPFHPIQTPSTPTTHQPTTTPAPQIGKQHGVESNQAAKLVKRVRKRIPRSLSCPVFYWFHGQCVVDREISRHVAAEGTEHPAQRRFRCHATRARPLYRW